MRADRDPPLQQKDPVTRANGNHGTGKPVPYGFL